MKIFNKLFEPVSIYPIIYFRVAFGLIILWLIFKYTHTDYIKNQFLDPLFNFTFWGFSWVRPLPLQEMHIVVFIMGLAALFLTIGLFYRISTALLFVGLSYFFLLDKSYYLNHFYLVLLINFLLIFIPANKKLSLDSYFKFTKSSEFIPSWCLWAFRVQVLIVYFYAGVAKINSDWLQGQPMMIWLYLNRGIPIVGEYLTGNHIAYIFSYSGLIIDLFIAPLLLFRRTRIFAIIIIVTFHLFNSVLFNIDIFPWLMIVMTLLFLEPERFGFLRKITKYSGSVDSEFNKSLTYSPLRKKTIILFLTIYFILQITLPVRHHFYPGNVNWTEVGHEFSWRMMLRQKFSVSKIYVYDMDTNKRFEVAQNKFLNRLQKELIAADPEMMLQFVEFLEKQLKKEGFINIEIKAVSLVSLNGRKPQFIYDSEINLLEKNRITTDYDWLNELENPLPLSIEEITENINLQKAVYHQLN